MPPAVSRTCSTTRLITLCRPGCLRRAAATRDVYRDFLDRTRPDYVLFPDVETVDGFVLVDLCASLGIGILYYVGMRILERGFFSDDPNERLPRYFGGYDDSDLTVARLQIQQFLKRRSQGPAPPPATKRLFP